MTIRILLFSLLPLLSFAQSNSKVTIQNNKQTSEKGPLEPKRNTFYNLDEIKVRWKKAALENCPMVVCPTSSVPGPCTTILATPMGPSSASVSFVPPTNDGGSPITGYVVTATPTSSAPAKRKSSSVIIVTGTSSPILLTGLSFGTNYIFSVLATNAVGGSPPITTTTTVTPCILNTAAASTNQTLVVNTALTNIMIATMGATGISNVGVSGSNSLPAGVSATWAVNTITISGTPTATGTFIFSIPLTGGCGSVNATGTITVNAVSLATLTTTAVSVVTDIGASSGGNITADGGAAITDKGVVWSTSTLPTVSLSTKTTDGTGTGIFTSTISGLTASTKYYVRSYATNTSGTSYGSELDFTTCTLNIAGTASSNPSLQVNTALTTSIMIATTGATGISNDAASGANGLPAGVSATWAGNTITISGTPTATGTFSYSIPLTGGCGSVNATGTITVCSVLNTAGTPLTSPTIVVNSAALMATPIKIATIGATGIGAPTGLPDGVIASWMSNEITIRDTPTVSGTFNYTIPLTGGCGTVNATGIMTVIPACPNGKDTIRDIDNNSYNIVAIGTQCWTKENLRVRKYNDGTSIVFDNYGGASGQAGSQDTWSNWTVGAHTIYANDSTPTTGNLAIYGYLYNWYAAAGIITNGGTSTKNICPTGWHVPTDSSWTVLTDYLGGLTLAGSKMKAISTTYWSTQSAGTNNSSNFSALPGGWRDSTGQFAGVEIWALFWSATRIGTTCTAWYRYLSHINGTVDRSPYPLKNGFSIRCLKD